MDGHRFCNCGAFPEMVGTMHTAQCFIRCPNCGARSEAARSPFQAWCKWDAEQYDTTDENLTIYEALK